MTEGTARWQDRVLPWWFVVVVGVVVSAMALALGVLLGPDFDYFDFQIYHRAVTFWLDGNNIYDYWQTDPVNIRLGYTYPPVAAVLMTPMALLPLKVAAWISVAATAVCGFLCVWLCVRADRSDRRIDRAPTAGQLALTAVITLGAFCTQPLVQTIGFGQVNVYLALLVLIDAVVLLPRKSKWTGVGVGLAMAIKLTPGIFLLLFLVNRRWRAMAVAVITAAAVSLLAAIVAPAETWRYFTQLIFESGRVGFLDDTMNQSVNGILARLSSTGEPSTVLWVVVCVVVVAVGLYRARAAVRLGDHLFSVTVIGLAGLLISPASWIHHAVWVVPALVITIRWCLAAYRRPVPAYRWIGPVLLLVSAVFIWVMDSRLMLRINDDHDPGKGLDFVVLSSLQVIWLAAALVLLPLRRPGDVREAAPAADPLSASATARATDGTTDAASAEPSR